MPKPMLKKPQTQTQTQTASILSATQRVDQKQQQQTQAIDKMKLDRILRKSRSKEYVNAVSKLDAGGHVHNKRQVDEIMEVIRAELPEVELSGILLGYVSKCYLGKPYEVHTLDISGQIIEHYKAGQPLPNGMEKARSIAMRGGYEFIEVYVDCCRAVSSNGTVSVITG
jgi:hypothetical protein